jgi:HupF/HypC family
MSGLTSSVHWGLTSSIPGPAGDSSAACNAADEHCITCSDEGIAMRVVASGDAGAVCADENHDLHEVAIDLVAPVGVGDHVLVHAGVAISRLGMRT